MENYMKTKKNCIKCKQIRLFYIRPQSERIKTHNMKWNKKLCYRSLHLKNKKKQKNSFSIVKITKIRKDKKKRLLKHLVAPKYPEIQTQNVFCHLCLAFDHF